MWKCKSCETLNEDTRSTCIVCKQVREYIHPKQTLRAVGEETPVSWTCCKCGYSNDACNQFCGTCGNRHETIPSTWICHKCGRTNDADSQFCVNCGNKLETQPSKKTDVKQRNSWFQRKWSPKMQRSLMIAATVAVVLCIGIALFFQNTNKTQDASLSQLAPGPASTFVHTPTPIPSSECVSSDIVGVAPPNITDTLVPALDNTYTVKCKMVDENTQMQSEYDINGILIRDFYILAGDNGSFCCYDHQYNEVGINIFLSVFYSDNSSEMQFFYDDDGRLILFDDYNRGELVYEFQYDYSRSDGAILVTCFDGEKNSLGSVVYGDDGLSEEEWNIDDPEEILVLEIRIIASFI